MNKIEIKFYNKTIFYEKLDNGLEVYVYPNNKIKEIYATFTTKYGGCNFPFKLNNKLINVPNGIAHFLEHKLFEQKNGIDPMQYYSKSGSECNAMTGYYSTSYLFSCTNNFKNNLNYLLNYVQDPYFTDSNVEKEKGIIKEEIKMYEDLPLRNIYDKLYFNLFNKHPIKYPISGYINDIDLITKEDIYSCYNAFYSPSNMFLTITGNVDADVIDVIRNNQNKKKFNNSKVEVKKIIESDKVYKKKEIRYYDVEVPTVAYGIKLPTKMYDMELIKLNYYISIIFDVLFDRTSLFYEECLNEKLLDNPIELYINKTDSHKIIVFKFKSKKYNKVINKINNILSNIKIDENDLNRKKKKIISKMVYIFDSIVLVNSVITDSVVTHNKIYDNIYDIINDLNINELNYVIKNMNISNKSIYILKKKS